MEEADAIQGMLDLGATAASVAHRLGRSDDYVRDRSKAASIPAGIRRTRSDFDQLTIGQLIAISRYDGQPDRQERLAHAAGPSNFDYILHNIEREDRDRRWLESVAALLGDETNGPNLIPEPEKPFNDPEWRYDGWVGAASGTPEETLEYLREQRPDAVSIHEETRQIYLWHRRDRAAASAEEERRALERAERDARIHALEEYAAASAAKRMAWLHANLHAIKRARLIETTARLGLLQLVDPDPDGFTKALSTWDDVNCGRMEYEKITGILAADGPHAAHTSLQTSDWPLEAVSILASRIEWFIEPSDWSGRDGDTARIIIDYYRILQDLGYTPANDETEHLDRLVANITEAAQSDDEDEEADE